MVRGGGGPSIFQCSYTLTWCLGSIFWMVLCVLRFCHILMYLFYFFSVMDPPDQFSVMRLQEPLPTALDLSMGCRQIPKGASSIEALDLVKKARRSDCNSGTHSRIVGVPESHVSRPFKMGGTLDDSQLDLTSGLGYEPRFCTVPLHDPNSLSLLDGLAAVAQMPSPCPPLDPEFVEHGRTGGGSAFERLIAASQNVKNHTDSLMCTRRSTRVAKNMLNGLGSQSQYTKTSCGGTNATDTVLPRTRSKGFLVPQDSSSPTPSLHSSSSVSAISEDSAIEERNSWAHEQTAVETLSSECSCSDMNSPCTVEYISSDDSDIIEVPVNSSTCKNFSSTHLLTGGITLESISNRRETRSSSRRAFNLSYSMDCKHDENDSNDLIFHNTEETMESSEVSSPILLQDSDPDTDALVSQNFPSTSDTENADILEPPQDGALSLSPSRPSRKKAPPSKRAPPKKKRRAKQEPKKKSPAKRWTKISPRSKAAAGTVKRRRKKSRPSGPATTMFSPEEPEIKLKYANQKEEKREGKGDGFAPYIHMELSSCTVVNFQEDDTDVKIKKGRQSSQSCVVSGTVPTTSCLQLGRLNSDRRSQANQSCCLCGRMANSVGLGDLHGPYRPWGPQPDTRCSPAAAKSASELGRLECQGRSASEQLREHSLPGELPGAPEKGSDCTEHWIHEDCSIWSSGVFLVKGKLYGLEEAIRLAGETVSPELSTFIMQFY